MNSVLLMLAIAIAVPLLLIALKRVFQLGVVLSLQRVLRGALGQIGEAALKSQPDQIHLSRIEGRAWKEPATVEKLEAPLLVRGFSQAGDFEVREFAELYVRFLLHAGDSVYAALYEHPKVGTWIDLVSRFTDGTGATFTNAPDSGVSHMPKNMVVHARAFGIGVSKELRLGQLETAPLQLTHHSKSVLDFARRHANSEAGHLSIIQP